jgi:DNA polymerase I
VYPCSLDEFDEIVFCDSEFHAPDGCLPKPICVVFYELRKRRITRVWLWERGPPFDAPPIAFSKKTLFVSYMATAELVLFKVLQWPFPTYVLDLNVEARNVTNGILPNTFISLYDVAKLYRVPYMNKALKDAMRDIAIAGHRVAENRDALMNYCEEDTLVMAPVLEKLLPSISLRHALIRGDFVAAYAGVEYRGLPVNVPAYRLIIQHRVQLMRKVADHTNTLVGPLYEGTVFKARAFRELVNSWGALSHWPRTPTGLLKHDEDTLELMTGTYPHAEIVRQAQKTMGDLEKVSFAIGPDARHRYLAGLFGTLTARNNPSTKGAILHRSRWWRNLLKPPKGWALAYLDFSSQEFLVQAAFAADAQGIADYASGDVYLAWGKHAGLIPPDGTRESHERERNLLKNAVLGLNYGMGLGTLAGYLGVSGAVASRLMQSFRDRYPAMVRFGEHTILNGVRNGGLRTRLDWRLHIREVIESKREFEGRRKPSNKVTPEAIRNWPIQSGASEILRLSIIEATARGLRVAGSLHDAVFIEAPVSVIEDHVQAMTDAMQQASETYLQRGHRLRVDAKVIRYPAHFRDKGTDERWEQIRKTLLEISGEDIEELSQG